MARAPSPIETAPQASRNLTEFLGNANNQADLLMNDFDVDDDDDGDSTIEGSWRPLPEKRRILAEATEAACGEATLDTPMSNKSSLDNFLDALIFDAKQSTNDDPDQHSLGRRPLRKNRRRSKSSAASVGSALERPAIYIRSNHTPYGGAGAGSGAATVHGGDMNAASASKNTSARTSGVLWARKSKVRQARPKGSILSSSSASVSSGWPPSSRGILPEDDSVLRSFLERESKHGRPTSAHSVAGDRVASGAVSIVLSEDGKSKTFTVGAREAKLVEKLLQATNEIESPKQGKPIMSTKSMKGWLEQVAGNLKSPSGHSEIANSARVSTRSSLAVELSPPLDDGKSSLKAYLDQKRGGRRNSSSAYTVAGDRVSVRFQGKSTQELLELLDADKKKKRLSATPPLTGTGPRRQHSQTAAQHARIGGRELENLKYSGAGASGFNNSMPILSFDPFYLNNNDDEDIRDSDRVFPRSIDVSLSPENRKDVQSMLDGRRSSQNIPGGRRARSTTPQKRQTSNLGNNKTLVASSGNRRASSTPRGGVARPTNPTGGKKNDRLGDSMNFKDIELADFRPPSSSRPMNRRSIMRKMHSVPILSDTNFDIDREEGVRPTRQNGGRRTKSKSMHSVPILSDTNFDIDREEGVRPTRQNGGRRTKSKSNENTAASTKSTITKSKKSTTTSSKKSSPPSKAEDTEMDFEELNKSFLDMFLDGEVDAHDSASQINNTITPKKEQLVAKDEYKATLLDAPIENSVSKLRIEPDFLESTNRIILQDPVQSASSRRDLLKKMKSVPTMNSPSTALMDLYDSPKVTPEGKPKWNLADDDEKPSQTPPDDEKAKASLKSSLQKKKAAKGKSEKKKNPKSNASSTADDHVKKSKPADDDQKSPKKKKSPKTPKGKKGKLSKDDKDGKNNSDKKARRSSGKHKTVVDDELGVEEKKATKIGSGKHKTALDDLPRQEGDRAEDQKSTRREPQMRLERANSCSNIDVRSLDEADKLLAERTNSLKNNSQLSPQTPTSERVTMGEKQLRKGRKPRNPNQTAPATVQSEGRPKLIGSNARWGSEPRGLGSGMASPRRSPRRERETEVLSTSSPRFPNLPFISLESQDENVGHDLEFGGALTPPFRKSTYQVNSQGLKPALKRDEFGPPPQSPMRYSRPIPTVGRENTVLECHDDDSVGSDITDQFSLDITEADIHRSKTKITSDLERIYEPDGDEEEAAHAKHKAGGSWAELSHSLKKNSGDGDSAIDRINQVHKSRRWSSMRNLNAAPKTPVRKTEPKADPGFTKTPTRLGWLKKKLGRKKKK
jgi:hypothetical protein